MSKKASVSLEAAIAFSVTVMFIAAMVSCIVFCRSDMLMQRAVSNTCRKLSLMTPLSTTITDVFSTAVNALPDVSQETGEVLSAASDVTSMVSAVDEVSGESLTELIMDGLLSDKIQNEIASEYIDLNGGSDFLMPDDIDVDFETDTGRSVIAVYVSYETRTITGRVRRNIYDVIPFYGNLNFFFNPEVHTEDDGSSVWELDNFTRGEYISQELGGDLPATFPVINSYEDGQARGITSIDLTSPWYSKPREIERRMRNEIDDLAEFDGASVNIDGNYYEVPQGSITSRVLQVVIPENSPQESVDLLESYVSYASSRGVDMEIIGHGVSRRYIEEEEE